MKKVIKLLSILMLCLSMFAMGKPTFVMAEQGLKTTFKLPVTVTGPTGTIQMVNWPGTLNNPRYTTNGPLTTPITKQITDSTDTLEVEFEELGNYVFEVKQVDKTNPNIAYDVDVENRNKIYRLYVSVIYDESEKLTAVAEAELCNDSGCPTDYGGDGTGDIYPEKDPNPKPQEICFENERAYWVRYLDGSHGKSDHGVNGDGMSNQESVRYGEVHIPSIQNTVTPHDGYQFTGKYTYVIYNDDGTVQKTGTISVEEINNGMLIVTGNIELTPIYKPVPTPHPTKTPPSGGGGSGWWVPYTGDMTHLALYTGIFGGSILLILILLLYRRKQKNTFLK